MKEYALAGTAENVVMTPEQQAVTTQKLISACMFVVVLTLCCFMVYAGSDETAVDDLWTTFAGYAEGAPGKIIALLSFLSAVWYGIARPNYTAAIGALMFCLLMANAKTIIEGFLTMSY